MNAPFGVEDGVVASLDALLLAAFLIHIVVIQVELPRRQLHGLRQGRRAFALAGNEAVLGRVLAPVTAGAMDDPRCVPAAEAGAAVDHHFFLCRDRDPVGGMGDVELGQDVDAVLQGGDVDVGAGRHQLHAGLVGKHAHCFLDAHEQALARAHAGMAAAGQGGVLHAHQVGGTLRAGFDAGRAGQKQVRSLELREFALARRAALTFDGVDLRLQRGDDLVLVARLVRLRLLRGLRQAVVQFLALRHTRQRLGHVGDVRAGVRPTFGAEQQAALRPHRTNAVGAQLETLAARILASGVVVDAVDMAEAELAGQMVALELRLDFPLCIIQYQMVAASAGCVAALGGQFPASEPHQRLLFGQLPRRHIALVVHGAGHDRMVGVTIEPLHSHFGSHARMAGQPLLATGPAAAHPYPAATTFVAVPVKLDLDASVLVHVQAALTLRTDHGSGLQGQQPGVGTVEAASGTPGQGLALADQAVLVLRHRVLALQVVVAGLVVHFQDQEFAGLAFTEMVEQLEPSARCDPPIIPLCFDRLAAGFDFFHAQPCELVGAGLVLEAVMTFIAVDLQPRYISLFVDGDDVRMDRTWILEVEAAHCRFPGRPLAQRAPIADRVFFGGAACALEANAWRCAVDRRCVARVVADLQHMTFVGVLVPIAVAGRLPVPAQVIVVGLVPLRGHRALRLFAGDRPLPHRQAAVAGEDRLGLLAQALCME